MPRLRRIPRPNPGLIPADDFPLFVPLAELRRVEAERDAVRWELARYRAVVEVLVARPDAPASAGGASEPPQLPRAVCPICNVAYVSPRGLAIHMGKVHRERVTASPGGAGTPRVDRRQAARNSSIAAAVASGESIMKIAQQYGISRQRVSILCRQQGVIPQQRPLKRSHVTKPCQQCGTAFHPTKANIRYCSRACAGLARRKEVDGRRQCARCRQWFATEHFYFNRSTGARISYCRACRAAATKHSRAKKAPASAGGAGTGGGGPQEAR